eukprot:100509-Pelagomonas_calceolata.AAC.2
MAIIAALQPDLYVALCDEITHDAKPKKIDQTIKRSAKVGCAQAKVSNVWAAPDSEVVCTSRLRVP